MAILTILIYVVLFCAGLGVVLGILIGGILVVYTIPYALWLGNQNSLGKHKDKDKESIWRAARNATKLYKSWITRKEPTF